MLLTLALVLQASAPPATVEIVPTLRSQIQEQAAEQEDVDSEGPALPASTVPS